MGYVAESSKMKGYFSALERWGESIMLIKIQKCEKHGLFRESVSGVQAALGKTVLFFTLPCYPWATKKEGFDIVKLMGYANPIFT